MTPDAPKQYHDPAIERHPVAIAPSEPNQYQDEPSSYQLVCIAPLLLKKYHWPSISRQPVAIVPSRIDHSKVPIALDKNRIHVFKRQSINAGTAARLTGLRQSDIRAKKERWRTSTRQRTTSRRAASLASKSKHPLSYFLQRWPSACLNGSSIIVGALQNIRHGQLC